MKRAAIDAPKSRMARKTALLGNHLAELISAKCNSGLPKSKGNTLKITVQLSEKGNKIQRASMDHNEAQQHFCPLGGSQASNLIERFNYPLILDKLRHHFSIND
jgi:hypothetical protein